MLIPILALACVSLVLSLLARTWISRSARKSGWCKSHRADPMHPEPVHLGGGLILLSGSTVTIALSFAAAFVFEASYGIPGVFRGVVPYLDGMASELLRLVTYLAGGVIVFLIGWIDDHRPLPAWQKLGALLLVAMTVVSGGTRLDLFGGLAVNGWPVAGYAISVVWLVGLTNVFNLLDHMDGICAGVAFVTGATFAVISWMTGQWFMIALLVPMLVACLVFLSVNFPPASLFLGDAGSLLLGYQLAVISTLLTFFPKGYPPATWLAPLMVLSVPAFDTISVIWVRYRSGRPLFEGDRNHLCHRLHARGMGAKGVFGFVIGLTLLTSVAGLALYFSPSVLTQILTFGAVATIFLTWTILEGRYAEQNQASA